MESFSVLVSSLALCFDNTFFMSVDQHCCIRISLLSVATGAGSSCPEVLMPQELHVKAVGRQEKHQVKRERAGGNTFSFSTAVCRLQKHLRHSCTSENPLSDTIQHRHQLETFVQRHLLVESQKPSGQWAHSWLQESPTALFWSKELRRRLVASEPDQAAGEIGIKALTATIRPWSDVLFFLTCVLTAWF